MKGWFAAGALALALLALDVRQIWRGQECGL
jgi:hypothetical protein